MNFYVNFICIGSLCVFFFANFYDLSCEFCALFYASHDKLWWSLCVYICIDILCIATPFSKCITSGCFWFLFWPAKCWNTPPTSRSKPTHGQLDSCCFPSTRGGPKSRLPPKPIKLQYYFWLNLPTKKISYWTIPLTGGSTGNSGFSSLGSR